MKNFFFLIAVIFIFIPQNTMAHGGHKKEQAPIAVKEEPSSMDPMYATEDKESDPFGESKMFSPNDLFMPGEIAPADPIGKSDMKMEGSHNANEDHNMPKVESAKHKAVETSAKGYGVAAGITLFAGLVFAGLTFIRPGE